MRMAGHGRMVSPRRYHRHIHPGCYADAVSDVVTITLTAEEARLARSAVMSMLEDFGHDEVETLRALKALLAKLPPETDPMA